MAVAIGLATLVTGLVNQRLNNISTLLLSLALTSICCSWALKNPFGGLLIGLIFGIPVGVAAIAARNA